MGQDLELNGCINDVINIKKLLIEKYDFSEENITILTDKTKHKPTKKNIKKYMKKFTSNAESGDILFFQYSGHGSQREDSSYSETDNFDETLVPLDHEKNDNIVDDDVRRWLVDRLPDNVKLVALLDCCHSGSALDLPFNYRVEMLEDDYSYNSYYYDYSYYSSNSSNSSSSNSNSSNSSSSGSNSSNSSSSNSSNSDNKLKINEIHFDSDKTSANVIMISGCRDNQTSTDACINDEYNGALTYYFRKIIEKNDNISFANLMTKLCSLLKENDYDQRPQLSCGNELDLECKFEL